MTRLIAIVPAVVVASLYGDSGTAKLLVLSQVILSLQLPFAVVPLVSFTSDREIDGRVRQQALAQDRRLADFGDHHRPQLEAAVRLL